MKLFSDFSIFVFFKKKEKNPIFCTKYSFHFPALFIRKNANFSINEFLFSLLSLRERYERERKKEREKKRMREKRERGREEGRKGRKCVNRLMKNERGENWTTKYFADFRKTSTWNLKLKKM